MVLAASVITSKAAYKMTGGLLRSSLEDLEILEALLVAFNFEEIDSGHPCIIVDK